jgi:hypothetical protein
MNVAEKFRTPDTKTELNAYTIMVKAPFLMTSWALSFGHLQGV